LLVCERVPLFLLTSNLPVHPSVMPRLEITNSCPPDGAVCVHLLLQLPAPALRVALWLLASGQAAALSRAAHHTARRTALACSRHALLTPCTAHAMHRSRHAPLTPCTAHTPCSAHTPCTAHTHAARSPTPAA